MDLSALVDAAVLQDEASSILEIEQKIHLLDEQRKNHREGFRLSTGTEQAGTGFSGMGTERSRSFAEPFVETVFPEKTGTAFRISAPLIISPQEEEAQTLDFKLDQNLNKILGLEKPDTAKRARQALERWNHHRKRQTRRLALEEKILTLLKELNLHQQDIINNDSELYEKHSLLERKLKAGMLLENGSLHLADLMEIKKLEARKEELLIALEAGKKRFERLTGYSTDSLPELREFPLPALPLFPKERNFALLGQSEKQLRTAEAELRDLKKGDPARIHLTLGSRQHLKENNQSNYKAGISLEDDNLGVALEGGWQKKKGAHLSAGLRLSLTDKTKKDLAEKTASRNLEIARLRLEEAGKNLTEEIEKLATQQNQLKHRKQSLELSWNFIRRYLEEMEAKYRRGLIRRAEILKARDQQKKLELDKAILNLDCYLLANRIKALME